MIGYADYAGVLSQFFLPIYRNKRPQLKYVGTSRLEEDRSLFLSMSLDLLLPSCFMLLIVHCSTPSLARRCDHDFAERSLRFIALRRIDIGDAGSLPHWKLGLRAIHIFQCAAIVRYRFTLFIIPPFSSLLQFVLIFVLDWYFCVSVLY